MFQRLLAILVLLAACALPAKAENGDIVHFGSDIVVAEGESAQTSSASYARWMPGGRSKVTSSYSSAAFT